MNRCEEVLAKKKNPFRSNEPLKHSETYMGVEFTEDLTHWKYIKKYKNSKGKTVYVYANKETHDKIKDFDNKLGKLTEKTLSEAYQTRYDENGNYRPIGTSEKEEHYRRKQKYKTELNKKKAQFDKGLAKRDVRNIIKYTINNANNKIKNLKRDAVIKGVKFISSILKEVRR